MKRRVVLEGCTHHSRYSHDWFGRGEVVPSSMRHSDSDESRPGTGGSGGQAPLTRARASRRAAGEKLGELRVAVGGCRGERQRRSPRPWVVPSSMRHPAESGRVERHAREDTHSLAGRLRAAADSLSKRGAPSGTAPLSPCPSCSPPGTGGARHGRFPRPRGPRALRRDSCRRARTRRAESARCSRRCP